LLDAAAIRAEAEARAGIADREAPLLGPHLDRLVASINEEAGLSPRGAATIRDYLVKRTADRLGGLKWMRHHPEIGAEAIERPVFLTGLPRSGTTFFQYLFDRDPRFRLIRTWEAGDPSPPPGSDPSSAQRRLAEETARRQAFHMTIPGFDALHLADAEGPEECHAFLEQSYAAAGFHNLLAVPSYFDYLTTALDFLPVYRAHKRQLQLLQWRMARPRWALKYPNHVLAMDAICAVYPDARFVMTHRDPVQTLASICKLTLTLRESRSDKPADPHLVGRHMLRFVQRHIDRIMAFARSGEAGRVTHVDYYRLIDDPAQVMAEVHAGLGLDTPGAVRDAVDEWHRRNPKGARGANPYALESFGLREAEVAERFGPYMRHFDIPREKAGLARQSA
jgi:Sulfotransferase family